MAGKTLFIDPYGVKPNSTIKPTEVTKADLVYVTYDHPDHPGDAFDICKRTGAVFVAVYELAEQTAQNRSPKPGTFKRGRKLLSW